MTVYDANARYNDIRDQAEYDIMEQALAYRKGRKLQYTRLYPSQVNRVWLSYSQMDIVLHPKAVDNIIETMEYNTAILDVMTACQGHAVYDGIKEMVYRFELSRTQERKLNRVFLDIDDWAQFSNGHWLLSDYGLTPLINLLLRVYTEPDYGRKICYLDQMLSVTHQRSDLTELFIHGGSASLTYLSEFAQNTAPSR